MGLLCGESTLRRCLNLVHKQAVELGFYSLPEKDDGNVWCWGDDRAAFTKAVNLYVKTIYCDACCDSVTANDPWIVPLTGDATRTSQRGTIVTVLGPKMADRRLVNQQRSMKTMYQGSDMYTPACAGYATEDELMDYFHLLIAEFRRIEAQQYCVVNGNEYTVYIEVVVIISGLVVSPQIRETCWWVALCHLFLSVLWCITELSASWLPWRLP